MLQECCQLLQGHENLAQKAEMSFYSRLGYMVLFVKDTRALLESVLNLFSYTGQCLLACSSWSYTLLTFY